MTFPPIQQPPGEPVPVVISDDQLPIPVAPANGYLKSRRESALIATLGLVIGTGAALGGLTYHAVVNGDQQSLTQLGTLATLGLGGLLALSGGKKQDGGGS